MALDRAIAAARRAATGSAPDAGADRNGDPSRFMRGLALGALVGAAIAGSTVWQRRRVRDRIQRELKDSKPADG